MTSRISFIYNREIISNTLSIHSFNKHIYYLFKITWNKLYVFVDIWKYKYLGCKSCYRKIEHWLIFYSFLKYEREHYYEKNK
jgi:hypothetical protein